MTLTKLRAGLAYWERSERWAKARHTAAYKTSDHARQEKWSARLKHCRAMIAERRRQIAALVEAQQKHRPVRERAVDRAASFAGRTVEHPAGSNRGGIISTWQQRIIGADGYPWCGCFVGCILQDVGVKGVGSWIAGVAAIEDQARAGRGCFQRWTKSTAGVRRGDLVVLFGRGVHVEMVRYVTRTHVYTIGGNTSAGDGGSQANGGGVFLRARPLAEVHGFAIVDYPG